MADAADTRAMMVTLRYNMDTDRYAADAEILLRVATAYMLLPAPYRRYAMVAISAALPPCYSYVYNG